MSHPLLAPAETLGITIAPEWEASVLADLRLLLRLGGEVAAAVGTELPDWLDPLPLDRPPEPS
jgi:hypothetical protein